MRAWTENLRAHPWPENAHDTRGNRSP